jgi:hypothetical protein
MLTTFVSPLIYSPVLNFSLDTDYNISFNGTVTPANVIYQIYCTTGLSAGIGNGKKYLRFIGNIPANTTDVFNFKSLFTSRNFNTLKGNKIFISLKPIEVNSGISGHNYNLNCIVN